MITTIELSRLDTRYSRLRMRDSRREQTLLSSILEQGILDPLYVINSPASASCVLLDGFKRTRCALKLKVNEVPVVTLDNDEAMGMLKLLRLSASKGMNPLEEAGLVDELHQRHGLSIAEISRRLERSVSWVSVRLGMLAEMSPDVREKVFSGHFPVRSYMYTLRPFTRVNNPASRKEVELFIKRVSGNRFSSRDIDMLAGAWFKGGAMLKAQLKEGNLDWTLRQLKSKEPPALASPNGLSETEARVVSNLEIMTAYIYKLTVGLKDAGLRSEEFLRRGRALAGRLVDMLDGFKPVLKEFYEKCGKAECGADAV